MLHRSEALLLGESDVRRRHVVLEVDERLGAGPDRRDLPAGLDVEAPIPRAFGNVRGRREEAERDARLRPGPPALLQGGPQAECAVARPGAALGLDAVARHEAGVGPVVRRTPPGLRVQVNARAPAAGAEHQIAVDAAALAGLGRRREERGLDGPVAGDTHHRVTTQHLDPARDKLGRERLGRMHPDVR